MLCCRKKPAQASSMAAGQAPGKPAGTERQLAASTGHIAAQSDTYKPVNTPRHCTSTLWPPTSRRSPQDLGVCTVPVCREENIRRIGEVGKLFADQGLITLVSFISPYRYEGLVGYGGSMALRLEGLASCLQTRALSHSSASSALMGESDKQLSGYCTFAMSDGQTHHVMGYVVTPSHPGVPGYLSCLWLTLCFTLCGMTPPPLCASADGVHAGETATVRAPCASQAGSLRCT